VNGRRAKGDTPLESPAKRGYTPLDTPERWEGNSQANAFAPLKMDGDQRDNMPLVHNVMREFTKFARGSISESLRGVQEGRSPSFHIFPFPSGEGDTGDGA